MLKVLVIIIISDDVMMIGRIAVCIFSAYVFLVVLSAYVLCVFSVRI